MESGTRPAATSYKAGDLVRVTLTLNLTKERRFVAVTDPLPAGFEAVESWFATSAASLAAEPNNPREAGDWTSWWRRGGFDHVERHDDRVQLFATRLGVGRHTFTYVARATTAGLSAPRRRTPKICEMSRRGGRENGDDGRSEIKKRLPPRRAKISAARRQRSLQAETMSPMVMKALRFLTASNAVVR